MILIAVGYIALYFCIKFHFNKQHEFLVPQLWFLWFLALGFVSPIYFFLRNESLLNLFNMYAACLLESSGVNEEIDLPLC